MQFTWHPSSDRRLTSKSRLGCKKLFTRIYFLYLLYFMLSAWTHQRSLIVLFILSRHWPLELYIHIFNLLFISIFVMTFSYVLYVTMSSINTVYTKYKKRTWPFPNSNWWGTGDSIPTGSFSIWPVIDLPGGWGFNPSLVHLNPPQVCIDPRQNSRN